MSAMIRNLLDYIQQYKNTEPISPLLHIAPGALVLDVGSGHHPHPRADILCDKSLVDDTEREQASIIVDRPCVLGDAQALPFRANTFDYVIARHVLEHVEKPSDFFKEIKRIGAGGYIEAPSLVWEYLHPRQRYHKWLLLKMDETIVMVAKPMELCDSVLGSALEEMGRNSLEYRLFIRTYKDLFYIGDSPQKLYHLELCLL
jgi:SAM-dependent methyltransferase